MGGKRWEMGWGETRGEVKSLIIFAYYVGFVNSREVECYVGSSVQGGFKN